jgi:hypothetical protein
MIYDIMYPGNVCILVYILLCMMYIYRGVLVFDCTRQVYNLGNGGVPVHHDPVDGIWAKQEK